MQRLELVRVDQRSTPRWGRSIRLDPHDELDSTRPAALGLDRVLEADVPPNQQDGEGYHLSGVIGH
eukprot:1126450-Prymnesium_polylepis.1